MSFAGIALVLITAEYLGETPDLYLLGFVFFGIITGYNFVKYAGVAKLYHRSLTTTLRSIQVFSLVSFLAAVYCLLFLDLSTIFVAAVCGVLTLFYAIPFFPGGLNLRNRGGVKIFLVVTTWAGVTVFMPAIHLDEKITPELLLLFLQRLLFLFAVALPFEIRDLRYDQLSLGTVPQTIGIRKTKYLGWILLLLFVLISFIHEGTESPFFWSELLVAVIASVFLFFSPGRHPNYENFWVEALPVFWLAVLWSFQELMH